MGDRIDITGQRFGRLIAIEQANKGEKGRSIWKCVCDCGREKNVSISDLRRGNTTSCGCYRKETASSRNKEIKKKHGETHTRLYSIWRGMKKRCTVDTYDSFHRYGGRGIKICSEWLENFSEFSKWAKENGYKDNLTLDRIDVNGNYCPENCRWVSMKEQSRNRRTNHNLTFCGNTHTISEWSEITGIGKRTILERLHRGWTVDKALKEPVHGKKNEDRSVMQWKNIQIL